MPSDFVDAGATVPGLIVDMRYAGTHNFVGSKIDGYAAPRCLLTRKAASALAAVQADLQRSGLGLKVFDCYRPARAVAHFVRWARAPGETSGKSEFYPNIEKRVLFTSGYIASRSAHSRGSTVDLTVVDRDGKELKMGTPFDYFGPESGCCSATGDIRANRQTLQAAMARHGFSGYSKEWWHFTLRGEPYASGAFDGIVR